LNSLGVRLVITHGARPQIEALLQERHLNSVLENELRVTDADTLNCVKQAVGALRADIESQLSMGLANSPMHGAQIRAYSGNLVTAKPIGVLNGVDFQHTGLVRKIDVEGVNRMLDEGVIVLLPPLGYSPTGEIFNLAVEDVATQAATLLGADKLIAFDEHPGILNEQGELQRELLISNTDASKGNNRQRTLHAVTQACTAGVNRGHIISYQHDGALLQELFTRDGAGSMISVEGYEQIRPATIDDVGGIIELIKPYEEDGTLVKRSRELLENEISRFTVIERDGTIITCAALYPYTDDDGYAMAEMTCVVTHPDYQGGNRAARILQNIETQADKLKIKKMFVLTTRAAHWFIENGFVEQNTDELPAKRQSLYNYQRNSKIFIKEL
jgi:amino-acid N-acetyltransferase